mmetsp:Transcript_40230/g.99575  ORF Transcript_40230/g.99575 Transcript_40230/m.99575 type:complete len:403 (-) Transcript_40230:193-1401(-)
MVVGPSQPLGRQLPRRHPVGLGDRLQVLLVLAGGPKKVRHHELGALPHAALAEAQPRALGVGVLFQRDASAVQQAEVQVPAPLQQLPRPLQVALIFGQRPLLAGVSQPALAAIALHPAPLQLRDVRRQCLEELAEAHLRPHPAGPVGQGGAPQQLHPRGHVRVQRGQPLLGDQRLALTDRSLLRPAVRLPERGAEGAAQVLARVRVVDGTGEVRAHLVVQQRLHPLAAEVLVLGVARQVQHALGPAVAHGHGHGGRGQVVVPLDHHVLRHPVILQVPLDDALGVLDVHALSPRLRLVPALVSVPRPLQVHDALGFVQQRAARLAILHHDLPGRLGICVFELGVLGPLSLAPRLVFHPAVQEHAPLRQCVDRGDVPVRHLGLQALRRRLLLRQRHAILQHFLL